MVGVGLVKAAAGFAGGREAGFEAGQHDDRFHLLTRYAVVDAGAHEIANVMAGGG